SSMHSTIRSPETAMRALNNPSQLGRIRGHANRTGRMPGRSATIHTATTCEAAGIVAKLYRGLPSPHDSHELPVAGECHLKPAFARGKMSIMFEVVDALLKEAFEARREHRHASAKHFLTDAVELCRKANDRERLAKTLTALGQIERDLNQLDIARKHYQE